MPLGATFSILYSMWSLVLVNQSILLRQTCADMFQLGTTLALLNHFQRDWPNKMSPEVKYHSFDRCSRPRVWFVVFVSFVAHVFFFTKVYPIPLIIDPNFFNNSYLGVISWSLILAEEFNNQGLSVINISHAKWLKSLNFL